MKKFTAQFKNKTVLVVGDVMLDDYILGNITRMSPEAPKTPVILTKNEKRVLGGAANVANNIVSLGGKAILLGCVGNDENGTEFRRLLAKAGVKDSLFTSPARPTTTKTRIFDGERQVARVDDENNGPLSSKEFGLFTAALRELPSKIDMVVVSDYAKGMVSPKTMQALRKKFSGEKIIADVKPVHKDLMRELCMITPNLKEVSLMAGVALKRHEDIRITATRLAKELDTSILATMGREGMMLCEKRGFGIHRVSPPKVRAVDVTGAGDVATAACALALASGASLIQAAEFANGAAAISVTKLGTATVTQKEAEKIYRG
jgi:D-beta-D-heptose 7-phosphate kinase/D-beta-D-heptose 1-phosphate adenosyltransferase